MAYAQKGAIKTEPIYAQVQKSSKTNVPLSPGIFQVKFTFFVQFYFGWNDFLVLDIFREAET